MPRNVKSEKPSTRSPKATPIAAPKATGKESAREFFQGAIYSPFAQRMGKFMKDAAPIAATVTAVTATTIGFVYFGGVAPVVNAISQLVPSLPVDSLATQYGVAFAESLATLGAGATTWWAGSRIRKASALEKQVASLELANNAKQTQIIDLQNALKLSGTQLEKDLKDLNAAQAKLLRDQNALASKTDRLSTATQKAKDTHQKKVATLKERAAELNDRARALDDFSDELNAWEIELKALESDLNARQEAEAEEARGLEAFDDFDEMPAAPSAEAGADASSSSSSSEHEPKAGPAIVTKFRQESALKPKAVDAPEEPSSEHDQDAVPTTPEHAHAPVRPRSPLH